MANFEIVDIDGKRDTTITIRKKISWGYVIRSSIIFGNDCIMGGNGVPFPFIHYASLSSTTFYNVACNLASWCDLLFMTGFFYENGDRFKFHSRILKVDLIVFYAAVLLSQITLLWLVCYRSQCLQFVKNTLIDWTGG